MYLRQLPINEAYVYYKRIKQMLIQNDVYSLENMMLALDSKVVDIDDLI